jgi:hypothetical protein
MVEYLFISSVMNGIWRSLCNVKFETYHGTQVMVCSTFDWCLWIIFVFDGLAHPHSWIPYVQIGFNMRLYYITVLFSRESLDFRPKSYDICRTFKLSCWRFVLHAESVFLIRNRTATPRSQRTHIRSPAVRRCGPSRERPDAASWTCI